MLEVGGEGVRAVIMYLLHWWLLPHRAAVLLYLPTVMLVSDLFVDVAVGSEDHTSDLVLLKH